MATSLRLIGNRDLAAQYWGEAKRVLFQLNQVLEAGGIDTGARHLSYPDGTTISVRSFFGNEIIEITSPFFPAEAKKEMEKTLFILCYRSGSVYKIYSMVCSSRNSTPSIEIAETDEAPTLDIVASSSTGTAMAIESDEEREKHVISYGLSYVHWIRNMITGGLFWNMPITYEDRYLWTKPYPDPNYGTVYQMPTRMVSRFNRQSDDHSSFYDPYLYFPKLAGGAVEWSFIPHSSYAEDTDIVGRENYSFRPGHDYAGSWGERICEQGDAPYSYYQKEGAGPAITNPFMNDFDFPYANWIGRYSWPIIGTLNTRKIPKIYSLQYEDDGGTHTVADYWTETLDFNETDGNGSGSSITYWPIAAIGNKEFLYLRNTLSQSMSRSRSESEEHDPRWAGGDWHGTIDDMDTYSERINQEFFAGSTIIEPLQSRVSRSYTRNLTVTPTGAYPAGTFSETKEETFSGSYAWVEVLDYSSKRGNLIVFYKKITENIEWPRSYSDSGVYAASPTNPRTVADSRIGTSSRRVEYYLAAVIEGALYKNLLATFDGTLQCAVTFNGEDNGSNITGTRVCSSSENGSGQRIYGVSSQMNGDFAVFSFNKETFAGTGPHAADYFKAKASLKGMLNWFGDGIPNTDPLPYPSPLEDLNEILNGGAAWSGNFCVGAMNVSDPDMEIGYFDYREFPNQTDIVSATGVIVIPQGG